MKKLLSLLLALVFLTAACGSSDDAGDDSAVEETTTTTASETEDDSMSEDDSMTESSHCDAVKTPGTLTVATGDPVFPPWMEDDDPSNGRGFESAVVYAVADEIGLDVAWVRTTFDQGVAPGEKDYDFNIQQFSITDVRDEVVDFSIPYYVAKPAIIATDPSKFVDVTSIADLKGLKLGAGIATTSLDYIEDVIQPDSPAAVFDDNVAAKAAFDAGQIDGLVLDFNTAFYVTAVEIDGSSIVGVLPETTEGADSLGFVLEEGSELTPCLNEALSTLKENGTLDALAEQYLQTANDIPTLSN
jgi:polar amino acid transport system substrate-binding protein